MAGLELALVASAFVAGILMFLAPCTLPLVPAYLAFIAGIKQGQKVDVTVRHKIVVNSVYYVFGFSTIFIAFGVLAGMAGVLAGTLRQILVPLSGVLILVFALQMLHVFKINSLFKDFHLNLPTYFTAGSHSSSFVIGAAFALGWTPCVGPILATVLLLAGSSGTVLTGALLLTVFSLGLAIPFIVTAFLYSQATNFISTHHTFLKYTEYVSGLFLLLIAVLLLTNNFELTVVYGYRILEFIGLGDLLDYY